VYFKNWPFRVVPERSPDLWADRRKFFENFHFLLKNSVERKRSMFHVVWGYIGAGKSHSLLHFKWLLEKGNVVFIYSPLPKEMKRYGDLYKQGFFNSLNFLSFSRLASDIWRNLNPKGIDPREEIKALEKVNNEIAGGWLDFAGVMMKLGRTVTLTGSLRDEICLLSQAWLSGVRLTKRELRDLGVSANITEDSDFVRTTSAVIRTFAYQNGHVFWMLDDCHFFAAIKRRERAFVAIQQGLRDMFDRCPDSLCLLLSFATRAASAIEELLIEDLRSRMSSTIEISPLSPEESFEFVIDLITNERLKRQDAPADRYYPYTKEAIELIIQRVSEEADLIPRDIMKRLDEITTKAEREVHPERITPDFVKGVFGR